MSEKILCKKLNKTLSSMKSSPFPGELGSYIKRHISKQAWLEWLFMQNKIVNEYKLNLFSKNHRKLLVKQMKKFLNINV